MNYWTLSNQNIYVAAHRGNSAEFPENTLISFKSACDMGVDQVETDVRITKDGELVLMHDAKVDRTTNGTGLVKDMTLAEIKALDAGIRKGEQFTGEKVPTFLEFMELVRQYPSMTLDIELKEYPNPGWEETSYSVCDRVLKIVDEYGFTDRVVINTFSAKLHAYIHEKYGDKYRQHVYYPLDCMSDVVDDPYAYGYCCCMFRSGEEELNMATKEEFDQMLAKGPQPWAGACVKDESSVQAAIDRGAYLITCNNPADILRILKEKGRHQ